MQSAIKVLLLASAVCAAFGRPQSVQYAVGDPFTDGGHESYVDIGSHGVVAGRHEPLYADGMVRAAVDPPSGFGADDYASPRIPIGKRQAVVIDPALSVPADRSEKVYVVPAVNDPVVLMQPVFPPTLVTSVVVDSPLVKK